MKLRASTKIAVGFIALGAMGFGGSYLYTKFKLQGVSLNPIPTTDFCLVAVNPKAGVGILTANRMAQLVLLGGSFENQKGANGEGATGGSVKKRIPVKELLGILNGDSESVGPFISKMRESAEDESGSENAPLWKASDIQKAIDGDKTLRTKLEYDLNVQLDGTPIKQINTVAFFDGIRIGVPIKLDVANAKGPNIEGTKIVAFKPRLMTMFFKSLSTKFYDKSELQSRYDLVLRDSGTKEDVSRTLTRILASASEDYELEKAVKIAQNCTVLVNQTMISNGQMEVIPNDGGYNLKITLTDEGSKRLWKFSSENGTSLLVVSKGVPIASATIGTQLSGQELVIKQITDQSLVEDAVKLIRK